MVGTVYRSRAARRPFAYRGQHRADDRLRLLFYYLCVIVGASLTIGSVLAIIALYAMR